MNDISAGEWKQMRGTLKSWWGQLTDDDFDWIGGETDKLVGLIQEKYGQTRDQAEQEVETRFREYNHKAGRLDVKGALAATMETAQRLGATAKVTASEAATVAAARLKSASCYLQEKKLKGVANDVTLLVRNYPIPSMLIGLGLGFLLARSTKR